MKLDEPGYLPAIVGGILGRAIGGLLFGCAGFAYFSYELRDVPRGLPSLGALVVGVPAAFVGQVLGCWFVLRRAEFEAAGATAALLAVILAIGVYIAYIAISRGGDFGVAVVALLLWPFAPPALARATVVGVRSM